MAEQPSAPKDPLFDANCYVNNPAVERAWATRVVEQMTVYFNLLQSVPPRKLTLTPFDDHIHHCFHKRFPGFKLDVLEIDSLKSEENKEKWNKFCKQFENLVQDAAFGTLVRIRCSEGYTAENTIFVVRIQFLAIEIARNRSGLNDVIYEGKKKETEEKETEEKKSETA